MDRDYEEDSHSECADEAKESEGGNAEDLGLHVGGADHAGRYDNRCHYDAKDHIAD